VFPNAVLGVLLVFSGLELARAGRAPPPSQPAPAHFSPSALTPSLPRVRSRHLKGEDEVTVGYLTAGATIVLKTGIGCAVGILAALICGGAQHIMALCATAAPTDQGRSSPLRLPPLCWRRYSRGELTRAVLKGVPWPCLDAHTKARARQACHRMVSCREKHLIAPRLPQGGDMEDVGGAASEPMLAAGGATIQEGGKPRGQI